MQSLKVLVLTNMYPSEQRPYSGLFVQDHIAALEARGIDVTVVAINPKRSRLEYFTRLPELASTVRRRRPHVVHAQHTYCLHQLALLRPLTGKVPVVATFHEGEVGVAQGSYEAGRWTRRLAYVRGLKRAAVKRADSVVFVERSLPGSLGFEGEYDVIAPAIDMELFRPIDRSKARERLGLPVDARIVFFPSDARRKSFNKGFDILERALPRLSAPVELVTGGDISHADMPFYMNAADVVVQTSRFEASPMVLKEAMACNVPIVSTRAGDAEWLIGDTKGHFMCDWDPAEVAEAIDRALDGADRTEGRDRLVELGVTLDAVAARYVDIYLEAIAKKDPGSRVSTSEERPA